MGPPVHTVRHLGGPDPGIWTGIDGMAEGWFQFLEARDDFHVEADDQRALDGSRVLALIRRSGTGHTSPLAVAQMQSLAADVFHVLDGKVIQLIHYWDRARALTDLGLAE